MPLFHLKAEIEGISPKIIRDVIVDSNISFYKLHHILQILFGWTNSHLYYFDVDEELIGNEDSDGSYLPANKTKLKSLLYKGKSFEYLYDFGDNWIHKIKVVKVFPADKLGSPICVGGERNSPPEDIGGVPGYEDLLMALKDKENPNFKELLEYHGNFDPEHFDMDYISKQFYTFDKTVRQMKRFEAK